jgi:hypothetical protein
MHVICIYIRIYISVMYVESSILHPYFMFLSPIYPIHFPAAFICPSYHNSTPSFLPLLYIRTIQVAIIYNTLVQKKTKIPAAFRATLFQTDMHAPIN